MGGEHLQREVHKRLPSSWTLDALAQHGKAGGWGGVTQELGGRTCLCGICTSEGERAASRFPAITRHVCYCRFINEACGREDWLVHCVIRTGGK